MQLNSTGKWKSLSHLTAKVSEFVGIIGHAVRDMVSVLFRNRSKELYKELIEVYKERILELEIEAEYHKAEKAKYEQMLFQHIGLTTEKAEQYDTQKPIPRPLSLSRIKSSLELASRVATRQEKK